MPPADAPERCLAVYSGETLIAALELRSGPVYADGDAVAPLLHHAALSGRLANALRASDVVAALCASEHVTEVVDRLRAAGLEVVPTPRSALGFVLDR